MLSPVPALSARRRACLGGDRARARRGAGRATSWPSAAAARSGRHSPVGGREVAGPGGVAAVGERRGAGRGRVERDVVVRQQHVGHPGGGLGLVVAQPAELGGGERRDQHAADRLGAGLRSPVLGDQVERRRPRTGCRSRAARRGPARRRRPGRPCRAAGRPTPTASARSPRPAVAASYAASQARGSTSVPGGCGALRPTRGRCRRRRRPGGPWSTGWRSPPRARRSRPHNKYESRTNVKRPASRRVPARREQSDDRRDEDLRRLPRRRRGPALPRTPGARGRRRRARPRLLAARRTGRPARASATRRTRRPPASRSSSASRRRRRSRTRTTRPSALEDEEDLDDGEVGAERAGRLVDPDEGTGEDTEIEPGRRRRRHRRRRRLRRGGGRARGPRTRGLLREGRPRPRRVARRRTHMFLIWMLAVIIGIAGIVSLVPRTDPLGDRPDRPGVHRRAGRLQHLRK